MKRTIERHDDGTLTLTLEGYWSVSTYTTHVPCTLLMEDASDEDSDDVVLVTPERPAEGIPEATLFVFKKGYGCTAPIADVALASMVDQWGLTPDAILPFAAHMGLARASDEFRGRFMLSLAPLVNHLVISFPVDENDDRATDAPLTFRRVEK